jgi:thioredoxin 1
LATDVNRDTFEAEVLQASEPVMVDFWGPQCRPCLALMPAVERLEEEHAGKLKVTKVNAVENRMLCAKLRVLSLPSYVFYKDGAEVKRLGGDGVNEKQIAEAIKEVLG